MYSQQVQQGAQAFRDLLEVVKKLSDDTADPDSAVDTRDYVAMFGALESSLNANLVDAGAGRREGFIRALTDLICVSVDCACPNLDWDPIETTNPAFARRGPPPALDASAIDEADKAARLHLVSDASGGIETLANVLLREVDRCDDEMELSRFTAIAIKKIRDLNSVILSVHGSDVGRKTSEMKEVVYG
jgi:hypothetical protein